MPYPERIDIHRAPAANIALALSTKDRTDLTQRMLPPLVAEGDFDLYWMDGSVTEEGKNVAGAAASNARQHVETHYGVVGGPDAAIVYSLSYLLSKGYNYVGLIENDVLLSPGWFDALTGLFESGGNDGLSVGAATVRPFDKRTIWARSNYRVLFGSGAGMILFSRDGAEAVLRHYRTSTAGEIRRVFQYVGRKDVAFNWEFTGNDEHAIDVWPVSADWYFDAALAKEGYCVLGSVPGYAENIDADLKALLGIKVASEPANTDDGDPAFRAWLTAHTDKARQERAITGLDATYQFDPYNKNWVVYPHQIASALPGTFVGDWGCVWNQKTGPFSAVARSADATVSIPIYGPAKIVLSPTPSADQFGLGYHNLMDVRADRSVRYADDQTAINKRVVQFDVRRFDARTVTYYPKEVGARIETFVFEHAQPWMYQRSNFSFEDLRAFLGAAP